MASSQARISIEQGAIGAVDQDKGRKEAIFTVLFSKVMAVSV